MDHPQEWGSGTSPESSYENLLKYGGTIPDMTTIFHARVCISCIEIESNH